MLEPLTIISADGVELQAEYRSAQGEAHDVAQAACVLCHPHPQYGGSMHSLVIGELFRELPAHGVSCLRFNFRGVEGSGGAWDEGHAEQADVGAAVDAMSAQIDASTPLVLVGWSFGADMTLATNDARLVGWVAIAPPLHYVPDRSDVSRDPRPKHFVLGERDQFSTPEHVRATTAHWNATTIEIVNGADHFFIGRTDRVVTATRDFITRLGEPRE